MPRWFQAVKLLSSDAVAVIVELLGQVSLLVDGLLNVLSRNLELLLPIVLNGVGFVKLFKVGLFELLHRMCLWRLSSDAKV